MSTSDSNSKKKYKTSLSFESKTLSEVYLPYTGPDGRRYAKITAMPKNPEIKHPELHEEFKREEEAVAVG